jgi:SAM-dependent methyltransferase
VEPVRESQRFFEGKAEAYRQSRAHANPVDLNRMLQWLQLKPAARTLDVATGGGHTALALAGALPQGRVVATDVTCSMLQTLGFTARERKLLIDGVRSDACALPFRAGSFDAVASRLAPHHFAELPAFVREAARVLRPGGGLYVFDLTSPEDAAAAEVIHAIESTRDPSHVRSWPLSAWRAALDEAGLGVERLEPSTSTLDLEAWLARAQMAPAQDAEVRRLLREHPAAGLAGYGIGADGQFRLLRVEVLARKG